MVKTTADELARLIAPANVLGTPVEIGDCVVIPVVEYGLGFGGGGGRSSKGHDGEGGGGGGGISPVALVLISKKTPGPEGITIYSLRKEGPIAQAISAVSEKLAPQAIEAIQAMVGGRAGKSGEQG
jgi:uncharacterized spore protein YtfJ